MFFRTLIERIKRILQVCGTCFPQDNICIQDNSISHNNLYHSSRKRSRLQIRLESLCIKKNKGQKNPCQRLRRKSVIIRERFFDLRSVAAGLQDELQQGFSQFIFLQYIVCEGRYSFSLIKKVFILLPSHPHNRAGSPCLSRFQW